MVAENNQRFSILIVFLLTFQSIHCQTDYCTSDGRGLYSNILKFDNNYIDLSNILNQPTKPVLESIDCVKYTVEFQEINNLDFYEIKVEDDIIVSKSSTFIFNCARDDANVTLKYRYSKSNNLSLYSLPAKIHWKSDESQDCIYLPPRRNLISVADAQQSVVSGTAIETQIEAFTTYTVEVQARDSNGIDLTTGGDVFSIEIRNNWIVKSLVYWDPDTSTKPALPSSIIAAMVDNGDGTYSYSFSVDIDGFLTILIKLDNAPGIYVEYYDNFFWHPYPAQIGYVSSVNENWGTTNLFDVHSDWVTIKYYTTLLAPITGSYDIYLKHNDGSRLYFDGVEQINRIGTQWVCEDTFTVALTAGQSYDILIEYQEIDGSAQLELHWTYGGNPRAVITNYLSHTQLVGDSAYYIGVDCPFGYTGEDPLSPSACSIIVECGDGRVTGTEQWDDSNVVSGDGCSSTWVQEAGWSCIGGSFTTMSTCSSTCGDNIRVGDEIWDDGNTIGTDGCSADWMSIEDGWTCSQNASGASICTPLCGDEKIISTEIWDDGNTYDGDGWSNDCTNVEPGWTWSGGSLTTPSQWLEVWGDGLRVGIEVWDVGDTSGSSGWSQNCNSIYEKWIWNNGSNVSKDVCTKCNSGFTNNVDHNEWILNQTSWIEDLWKSLVFILISLSFFSCLLCVILKISSPYMLFASINQIQLWATLILFSEYLPGKQIFVKFRWNCEFSRIDIWNAAVIHIWHTKIICR